MSKAPFPNWKLRINDRVALLIEEVVLAWCPAASAVGPLMPHCLAFSRETPLQHAEQVALEAVPGLPSSGDAVRLVDAVRARSHTSRAVYAAGARLGPGEVAVRGRQALAGAPRLHLQRRPRAPAPGRRRVLQAALQLALRGLAARRGRQRQGGGPVEALLGVALVELPGSGVRPGARRQRPSERPSDCRRLLGTPRHLRHRLLGTPGGLLLAMRRVGPSRDCRGAPRRPRLGAARRRCVPAVEEHPAPRGELGIVLPDGLGRLEAQRVVPVDGLHESLELRVPRVRRPLEALLDPLLVIFAS
mmetsp:Transcript_8248/g.17125  ORF Transcript_8248/g.17125 Transcript_8248/m.17125 type:complete len:303 (+) Transcript_8248:107-1015(+)